MVLPDAGSYPCSDYPSVDPEEGEGQDRISTKIMHFIHSIYHWGEGSGRG